MPFTPELHYFYLYLKQHIEQKHHIVCERADAQVLTVPLLDKINDYILQADVIIADCSGRNPNVFYELGIAHAHSKKVILITNESIRDAPSDVRHFEFIHYDLDKHVEFFDRLDNALRNVFRDRYEGLYQRAERSFHAFKMVTNAPVTKVDRNAFIQQLAEAEQTRELPNLYNEQDVTEFVLPRIIAESRDLAIMVQITEWIASKFKSDTRSN